ncbi:hypothetical protein QL285_010571 [Trifolium repens]|nr:hypothetical protein QL285_010571 [Trifolium repens]
MANIFNLSTFRILILLVTAFTLFMQLNPASAGFKKTVAVASRLRKGFRDFGRYRCYDTNCGRRGVN